MFKKVSLIMSGVIAGIVFVVACGGGGSMSENPCSLRIT